MKNNNKLLILVVVIYFFSLNLNFGLAKPIGDPTPTPTPTPTRTPTPTPTPTRTPTPTPATCSGDYYSWTCKNWKCLYNGEIARCAVDYEYEGGDYCEYSSIEKTCVYVQDVSGCLDGGDDGSPCTIVNCHGYHYLCDGSGPGPTDEPPPSCPECGTPPNCYNRYCSSDCGFCGCSENTCDGGICNSAVPCSSTSCPYRFTKETRDWQACSNCSGSEVPGSSDTTYSCDCNGCYSLTKACYDNCDWECRPRISNLQLFDHTGIDELTIQETTEGEEFYMSLYQRFRIPGSQASLRYNATRAKNCSLNCEYLSLDYIQEGIGPEYLPYPCNVDADGNFSFNPETAYSGERGEFYVSPQYRGLVRYNLTCYGPEGGPGCGHDDPYTATKTINLVLYDFTYREISPNEIINYLKNQLASVSQIINQNLNTLREIVKI